MGPDSGWMRPTRIGSFDCAVATWSDKAATIGTAASTARAVHTRTFDVFRFSMSHRLRFRMRGRAPNPRSTGLDRRPAGSHRARDLPNSAARISQVSTRWNSATAYRFDRWNAASAGTRQWPSDRRLLAALANTVPGRGPGHV